jgi:methionyl aminopeptidase
MDEQTYEKYKRAGKIAAVARDLGADKIKEGTSFIEVATIIESYIRDQRAGIAFPVNIALNTLAAHYTPLQADSLVFKKGDVVKLDVGAHVDGYIADTAITLEVSTNKFQNLILASGNALDNAIKHMKAGIDLTDIGKIVQDTISSFGYKPIDNLTGHSMERYELHSGMSVPNVTQGSTRSFPKPGDVLAIEPFATTGIGHVITGKGSNIYICMPSLKAKLVRDAKLKSAYAKIHAAFSTLPFAHRWCEKLFPDSTDIILKKLAYSGLIRHYPQLVEAKNGMVSQKEHTVIVHEDGCEVIT